MCFYKIRVKGSLREKRESVRQEIRQPLRRSWMSLRHLRKRMR